jgi:p-methyltransferase
MDWEQGCEMVLKLFNEVADSQWLPMYDFDFWILPYLQGKGLTLEQITAFVGACNDLLSIEIGVPRGESDTDRGAAESRLRRIGAEIREKNFAAAV